MADAGIRHVELELLTGWWLPEAERTTAQGASTQLLLRASEILEPYHVKTGPDIAGGAFHVEQSAERFHQAAEAFSNVGTVLSMEFMPFADVSTLAQAIDPRAQRRSPGQRADDRPVAPDAARHPRRAAQNVEGWLHYGSGTARGYRSEGAASRSTQLNGTAGQSIGHLTGSSMYVDGMWPRGGHDEHRSFPARPMHHCIQLDNFGGAQEVVDWARRSRRLICL